MSSEWSGLSPGEQKEQIRSVRFKFLFVFATILLVLVLIGTSPKPSVAPSATTEFNQPRTSSAVVDAPAAAAPLVKNAETISYTEYAKIEIGMTYDQVCDIVGSYGRELARTEMAGYLTVVVGWDGEGTIGANANVTFQNGKVMSKAQAGLQ